MPASVRRRFAFTLGANLLRSMLSFTTGMLLARWLAPQAFGEMAFLLGTFIAVRQLLDMGSSAAFFTLMSQQLRSRRFVRAFFTWLGLQFLIPLGVIGLLLPAKWIATIWHGEHRALVLVAFLAVFMQYSLWPVVQQAGESQRQTVRVQGITVAVAGIHLLAVMVLWSLRMLGLYAIFGAIAVEYLLAATVARRSLAYAAEPTDTGGRPVFGEYLRYCLPLIPYAWIGFAYEFSDRWLLQRYGGSVQQAYYAVSAQFAGVALIATSSILSIFWKEIAQAHHQGDRLRTGLLYRKVSRVLFFSGAGIAGFLCPWAGDLLRLILGVAYVDGASTLAIMFLYPIHQSMGQIGDTMLYATGRVSLQVVIGSIFMLVSIGATYLLLAPADALVPGFGLASQGLALKMVTVQFLRVNVVAFIIARLWDWRFDWLHQAVSLLGCCALGWFAHAAATHFTSPSWTLPAIAMSGGVVYLMLIAAFVYAMPWLAGMTRRELVLDLRTVLHKTTGLAV